MSINKEYYMGHPCMSSRAYPVSVCGVAPRPPFWDQFPQIICHICPQIDVYLFGTVKPLLICGGDSFNKLYWK